MNHYDEQGEEAKAAWDEQQAQGDAEATLQAAADEAQAGGEPGGKALGSYHYARIESSENEEVRG